MKLVQSDYMKIAIWWGKNDAFDRRGDRGGCKLIKGDFSGEGNEYIFGSRRFPHVGVVDSPTW